MMGSTLTTLTLDGVADYIKSGKCKRIAFLTGAGVSVGAGIPDFRSPGGMYDTLKPELLTANDKERRAMSIEPTTVVSWPLFKNNQLCYLELRRPFILGLAEQKWKATITHWFIKLCDEKGLLKRLYTQNIDGLDFQTDLPHDKIVTVHGTMGEIQCEFCKQNFPVDKFRELVKKNIKDIYKQDPSAPAESTPIPCEKCGKNGLKPATVLYGSSLPPTFQKCTEIDFPDEVDLLIIAGTSLTVSPANLIVTMVSGSCPRLLVNKDKVGKEVGINFDSPTRDVFCPDDCDKVFVQLIDKLGWLEDLKKYVDKLPPGSLSVYQAHQSNK